MRFTLEFKVINGVNGIKDLQKIAVSIREIKIFIQWNIFCKNTNKNICKKVNTHIPLYSNCLKIFLEAFCLKIAKLELSIN